MRVRTVYFKTRDLKTVRNWWQTFLQCDPGKSFPEWCEFPVGGMNLGFLSARRLRSIARAAVVHSGPGVLR